MFMESLCSEFQLIILSYERLKMCKFLGINFFITK